VRYWLILRLILCTGEIAFSSVAATGASGWTWGARTFTKTLNFKKESWINIKIQYFTVLERHTTIKGAHHFTYEFQYVVCMTGKCNQYLWTWATLSLLKLETRVSKSQQIWSHSVDRKGGWFIVSLFLNPNWELIALCHQVIAFGAHFVIEIWVYEDGWGVALDPKSPHHVWCRNLSSK